MEKPETKRCPKCGEKKPLTVEYFRPIKTKYGGITSSRCRVCQAEDSLDAYYRNRDKLKIYRKEYNKKTRLHQSQKAREKYRENPLKAREKNKKWQKNNPEKVRVMNRAKGRRHIQEVSDCYVKSQLRHQLGIYAQDVTQEMIKIKRLIILNTRLSKSLDRRK